MKSFLLSAFLLTATACFCQGQNLPKSAESLTKKWFDKISLRGYTQIRYNRLLETNPKLKCDQCDRSWGENGGFFIRRGRLIFSGDVSDRLYIYIQPDFASGVSNSFQHTFQIRDAYFDLALDAKKEFRFRVGQSKIPYGFENMQSSQNRLALDRADATNSSVPNERDLGVMFYWADAKIRERFAQLVKAGLKGSGDYGVLGIGAYNGQTANRVEANNNSHIVGRITYPFMFTDGQFIEASLQGYAGKFTIDKDTPNKATQTTFDDSRVAASFVVYPQPFGIQAEYNIGTGPEFDPATMQTLQKELWGGYAQAMYRVQKTGNQFMPFVKYQYYHGGKKAEIDARRYIVNDWEIGIEWQYRDFFELTALYTIANRQYEDSRVPSNIQKGNLLRLQAQFNF